MGDPVLAPVAVDDALLKAGNFFEKADGLTPASPVA